MAWPIFAAIGKGIASIIGSKAATAGLTAVGAGITGGISSGVGSKIGSAIAGSNPAYYTSAGPQAAQQYSQQNENAQFRTATAVNQATMQDAQSTAQRSGQEFTIRTMDQQFKHNLMLNAQRHGYDMSMLAAQHNFRQGGPRSLTGDAQSIANYLVSPGQQATFRGKFGGLPWKFGDSNLDRTVGGGW